LRVEGLASGVRSMPGLMRYEWKHRLRPVLRLVVFVLVVEGAMKVAEAYTASPLPRILSFFSTSDSTTVRFETATAASSTTKPVRPVRLRHGEYDPYAGIRAKQEREPDAPSEDGDAVPLRSSADNLPLPNLPKSERRCLAEAVYFEGRSETIEGQIAVAQVVLNRVRSGKWPDTICAVVRQGRGDSCQFPGVCKAGERPSETDTSWQRAAWIADDAAAGRAWLSELSDATHYHNASLKPPWRLSMKFIRKVGWRMYYADPKAAESLASLRPGQAPLAVGSEKIASEDARDAAATAAAAAEARRVQRDLQRARLASVEARQTNGAAQKSATTTTTVTKSVATEIFSRMER
jgi:spore germination cell wall hydrolase CwlJ-like protein